jgi:hypothetical protein
MTTGATAVNPLKAVVAVVAALAFFSLFSELLESSLVRATATVPLTDMASYFAMRNQPTVLAIKAGFNIVLALLAGYIAAKVAGIREMAFAGIAAALQTTAFAWGFTVGEFASQTPLWLRAFLLITTGPAMLAGAWIRMQARFALGGAQ